MVEILLKENKYNVVILRVLYKEIHNIYITLGARNAMTRLRTLMTTRAISYVRMNGRADRGTHAHARMHAHIM